MGTNRHHEEHEAWRVLHRQIMIIGVTTTSRAAMIIGVNNKKRARVYDHDQRQRIFSYWLLRCLQYQMKVQLSTDSVYILLHSIKTGKFTYV